MSSGENSWFWFGLWLVLVGLIGGFVPGFQWRGVTDQKRQRYQGALVILIGLLIVAYSFFRD
jgi:hypothetical protein